MKTRPTHVPELADLIAKAWEDHASDATFAGMSLSRFRTTVQPSDDTREALTSITGQRRAKRDERMAADRTSKDAIQRVVNHVKADPDHGPDSPLLAAMGYVTLSNRKSGKTNKKNGNGNGHSPA